MKITREWLDSKAACTSAVDAFLAVSPNGADLTRELLDHDVVRPHHDWLAGDLPLTASARATYDAATAPALWDAIVASGLNDTTEIVAL
jgi:hypothetical protein